MALLSALFAHLNSDNTNELCKIAGNQQTIFSFLSRPNLQFCRSLTIPLMEKTVDHVRLVKGAQLGDKESLDKLTEVAEERLRVDVFRLVLQEELAGEKGQESVFEVL